MSSPALQQTKINTRAISRVARLGYALAIFALLLGGGLSYYNIRRIARNEERVVHSHEVLNELRDILLSIAVAESSQRSYLITGDATYLPPERASEADSKTHFGRVRALTSDNSVQQAYLTRLQPMLDSRLDSLHAGIATRDAVGVEGARNYVREGKGRREMEAIRNVMGAMEKSENILLAQREQESRVSYRTALGAQWATTVLGLVLVLVGYYLAARELQTRLRTAESLARANDELESRVAERTTDLASANESLQRSNRELEQFASVASHDLQEPLRKIQAFGDRIQTRFAAQLGDQGKDYLDRMLASATRMRSLIDALLTFSRVTTKAQPFGSVNLAIIAEEVMADLEDRVQRMAGEVEIGTLPTITADPLQMRQLLQNLIGNGLKFARPGVPPVVQVQCRLLPGNSPAEVNRCEISVADNGIGFEETYLDRIFELFQRLHGRQEYEGTGMGLAICRKIVERHGGSITARSAPEKGATFLVTLPLEQ